MNTCLSPACLARVAATSLTALALCACASSPKPPAQSGDTARAETPASPSPPATPVAPPTASTISIAPDILKACRLPEADAYFPFDSARVTAKDRTPLDEIASCFTQGPLAGHGMKLVGHADPRGTSDYNLTLGQSRADSVAGYLGGRGMSNAKTHTTSRGSMDATGTDEPGWARDRRVDVLPSD
jgi:peptidoglycan-associated lipoprotein